MFNFGDAGFFGSMGGQHLDAPVVGLDPSPDGEGYWLAAADGGVFNFGDAGFFGSMGGTPLNAPVVGMEATPDHGYWLVAADGGVFNFGDAGFFGSMGGTHLNAPVVGMEATPDGKGYWLVAADGGVFNFGDAGFFGSMGGTRLNAPVVDVDATPDGKGYWLVAADGGVFNFGDAGFFGSWAARASTPRSSARTPQGTVWATGWRRPTAGCSAKATPRSWAPWAARASTLRWWAWPAIPDLSPRRSRSAPASHSPSTPLAPVVLHGGTESMRYGAGSEIWGSSFSSHCDTAHLEQRIGFEQLRYAHICPGWVGHIEEFCGNPKNNVGLRPEADSVVVISTTSDQCSPASESVNATFWNVCRVWASGSVEKVPSGLSPVWPVRRSTAPDLTAAGIPVAA